MLGSLPDEGIVLEKSTSLLQPLLAKPGVLTKRALSEQGKKNVAYGRAVARHLAQYDIGQTVVVAETACVAVETMEGTDATVYQRQGRVRVLGRLPNHRLRGSTALPPHTTAGRNRETPAPGSLLQGE